MKYTKNSLAYKALLFLAKSRIQFNVEVIEDYKSIEGIPIVFACNHSNKYDVPIVVKSLQRLCKVLVGKQRLYISDRIFFILNGCFWIDRKSRTDSTKVIERIVKWLNLGNDVLWFPEGTWNLSDNLLMLPMKWGIIEVAKRSHAQIIPMVIEYDRNSMTALVKFGEAMLFAEDTDKKIEIQQLRDEMATLRWELWERNSTVSRSKLCLIDEKRRVMEAVKEYAPLEYEYEKSVIFKP